MVLKRTLSGDVAEHETTRKKTKTSEDTVTEANDVKQQTTPPLVDSQSTITYSLENKEYEETSMNEVTAADRDILMSIIESDLNHKEVNNEPSTSDIDRHNNDVTVAANLMSRTIGNNETSYVSEIIDNDDLLLKIAKLVGVSKDQLQITRGGNMETVIESNTIKENPATEKSDNPFMELYPITSNNVEIKLPGNMASTSAKTVNNGEYHLYKHLMEMFTNASRKVVKMVCKRYNANKHQKPSDEIFSFIISDLLELTSSSSSDDSEKFVKANSTYIIPHSPEEQEKLLSMTAPPQANQEHPVNLVSRVSTPITQNPNVTMARNDVVAGNAGNVIRNAVPILNNVAPVVAPQNQVNDMLDDILTDLMETASDNEEEEVLAVDMAREETEQDNRLIYHLMEMFPEACPQFIRRICKGKTNAPGVLDDLISQVLENDYPRRQKSESPKQRLDPEEQLEMLKQIFPDADPTYLQVHCDRLIDKPDEMKVFIANAVDNQSYPKLKDYLRKQQISAQQKQYTSEFSVSNFLEVIPDPVAYFEDPKRKQLQVDFENQQYAIGFLRNHFSKIPLRSIRDVFKQNAQNFLQTYKALEKYKPSMYMKSTRIECRMPEVIQNIPLLQEIAYIKHRGEIEEHIRLQKVNEEEERAGAKAAGLLQTCSCCYDDEVMPKDIYTCESGCIFCKECVQRGAEVAFGDGKLDFVCLNNCASHFSLQTLQAVLKPKMFSKVAIRKQLEEVKAAGIEDLEMCPFCDFATIPAKDDKLFRCLNPECMKESCRLCKEPSHVPLRCDEVEKEDDVKIRTYIENKMTEALLRTCYKCNKKFIKSEGCNKMTCSCGAIMCYVCGKPVTDYKHFNGPGGEQFNLCPLYSDTNHLHEEAVLKGAEVAKKEVGVDSDPSKLKIDPTADVQQHYKDMSKKKAAQRDHQHYQRVNRQRRNQQLQNQQRRNQQLQNQQPQNQQPQNQQPQNQQPQNPQPQNQQRQNQQDNWRRLWDWL